MKSPEVLYIHPEWDNSKYFILRQFFLRQFFFINSFYCVSNHSENWLLKNNKHFFCEPHDASDWWFGLSWAALPSWQISSFVSSCSGWMALARTPHLLIHMKQIILGHMATYSPANSSHDHSRYLQEWDLDLKQMQSHFHIILLARASHRGRSDSKG